MSTGRGRTVCPPPLCKESKMIRLSVINRNIKSARAFIGKGGIYEVAAEVAAREKSVLLALNRDQLLSGRNSEGNLLSPDYLGDTYFKTRKAAAAYAEFKDDLLDGHNSLIRHRGLYPDKPHNIPNLIISGAFQGGMDILVSGRDYETDSSFRDAGEIKRKYDNKVFGFAPPSVAYFFNEYIRAEVQKRLWINGVRVLQCGKKNP